MNTEQFSRTELLLGEEAMEILKDARVAVFGIGGVGGYVAEALARSGVGTLILTDKDKICLSNLNRQIIALHSTLGRYKTEVMRERILDINPEARVITHECFYLPETKGEFDFSSYSYVVDAVDTVTAKLSLVEEAEKAGVPIISSMGAALRRDSSLVQSADILDTYGCPLAREVRSRLRKRGVGRGIEAVFSPEKLRPGAAGEDESGERVLGSLPTVTAVFGIRMAELALRRLLPEGTLRGEKEGKPRS